MLNRGISTSPSSVESHGNSYRSPGEGEQAARKRTRLSYQSLCDSSERSEGGPAAERVGTETRREVAARSSRESITWYFRRADAELAGCRGQNAARKLPNYGRYLHTSCTRCINALLWSQWARMKATPTAGGAAALATTMSGNGDDGDASFLAWKSLCSSFSHALGAALA